MIQNPSHQRNISSQSRGRKSTSRTSRTTLRNTDKDSGVNSEQIRFYLNEALKNDKKFKENVDKIVQIIDPVQKNWIPFKVKKQVADLAKDVIINADPNERSAQQKLKALKILSLAVLKRNIEFNKHILETGFLTSLQKLAMHNPACADDQSEVESDLNVTKSSILNTAQELMQRGQKIFGPDEVDNQTSANFLVILLDCLEKWSNIRYDRPSDGSANSGQSYLAVENAFQRVVQDLKASDVSFPSDFQSAQKSSGQVDSNAQKKTVSFNLKGDSANRNTQLSAELANSNSTFNSSPEDNVNRPSVAPGTEINKINAQKRRAIQSLKRKMLRVKEAFKKCKKFQQKYASVMNSVISNFENFSNLREQFQDAKECSSKCINFLKSPEYGPHIANKDQLLTKLSKYLKKFSEAVALINELDPVKSHHSRILSQVVVPSSKQQSAQKLARNSEEVPSALFDQNEMKKDVEELRQYQDENNNNLHDLDSWPFHEIDANNDRDKLDGSFYKLEQGSNGQPRMSQQIHIDLECDTALLDVNEMFGKQSDNPNFDFEEATNVESAVFHNFDAFCDQKEGIQLRKAKEDVDGLKSPTYNNSPIPNPQSAYYQPCTPSQQQVQRYHTMIAQVDKLEQQVEDLKEKNEQLETKLKEQAEIKVEAAPRLSISENFDMEQEIFKNFENAISSLNIELQKCKAEEHKMKKNEQDLQAEVADLKERESAFTIQIQQVHQAMDFLAAESEKKIDEKNAQVKTLEEYAEGYRRRIGFFEEQMAKQYYDQNKESQIQLAEEPHQLLSPGGEILEGAQQPIPSFLSPLNFGKLAFGTSCVFGQAPKHVEPIREFSIRANNDGTFHNSQGEVIRSPQDKDEEGSFEASDDDSCLAPDDQSRMSYNENKNHVRESQVMARVSGSKK